MAKRAIPTKARQHIVERRAEVAEYLATAKKFKRKIKIAFYTELLEELDNLLAITK
jgi:hypothetical protein